MAYKEYHPPHLYLDNQIYFLTVRCVDGQPYFRNKKNLILKIINEIFKKFNCGIHAFVILDNHFHLLLRVNNNFKEFIKNLNGRIAFEINKIDNKQGRKVIYQYWDHCIRDERDFWQHFNYIHQNPVKHGLCKILVEAFNYPFSSAEQWKKRKGEAWLLNCFELYPVVDFTAVDSSTESSL
jgi:putative transposase